MPAQAHNRVMAAHWRFGLEPLESEPLGGARELVFRHQVKVSPDANLRPEGELPAGLDPLEDQGLQVRPGRVQRRGVARRPGTDDDDVVIISVKAHR
jgi:hypothetical protein